MRTKLLFRFSIEGVLEHRWLSQVQWNTGSKTWAGDLRMQRVDIVKWIATMVQLVGYALTGLNIVPWNILAFIIGIVLWFLVGVMWKDRAIMVVHVGAFIAILGGYLNS
ncbi:ubiquinone biosynthesis methyltransferase UbiE [Loktanella sp. F6476L]|uniref:DUF6552 family protein n=1 Tax=Loktanella sp. F6476L TaxID=2926405 RepID=UPI001FF6B817|nr:DUF6552 family protein [Loktanella sp. F6476L]MCK0121379.1 ubiquinone biosynthesis methyltransferase UbiE [Loktanella sp. F6476L]